MSNVVEMLLRERENSYEVLIKNSIVDPIYTGHCPDCQHEHHKLDVKEEIISPTPIKQEPYPYHDIKEDKQESESESQSESESESESESINEIQSPVNNITEEINNKESENELDNNTDDDIMFL